MRIKSSLFTAVFLGLIFNPFFSVNANPQKITDNSLTSAQQLFLLAEKTLENNRLDLFQQYVQELKDYPLIDYLKRAKLLKELSENKVVDKGLARSIEGFLTLHNHQVVSRTLRYQWLSHLADTNQRNAFIKFYQNSSSVKLKCKYLEYQLAQSHFIQDITDEAKAVWLTGHSLPDACDTLIKNWQHAGMLSDELIWQRMILAAKNKQFRLVAYLNRMRPIQVQHSGDQLIRVTRNPTSLMRLSIESSDKEQIQQIVLIGLLKLAWKDPEIAIKAWKKFESRLLFTADETEKLRRSIGLSLAVKSSPLAKKWLTSLNLQDPSIDQWLLSAALNSDDWELIDYVTRQKDPNSIESDKWRYWRAISLQKKGFTGISKRQLDSLASSRSYYGFLAAIAQQKEPQLNSSPQNVSEEILAQLSNIPSAQRSYQFFTLGRLPQARQEWNQLVASQPEAMYSALAEVAHRWGWEHQSILAFAKSGKLDDVVKRFPFYRINQFQKVTKQQQIPLSWAYAITRQESAFKPDARSQVGAQGLMQLKLSTAVQVAKRQNLFNSSFNKLSIRESQKQLRQPLTNIKLGVAHLKEMLDYYNGNAVLATAAYNAGKYRVNRWLKKNRTSDSVLWIEKIPYRETREYVKNVLTYQQIYNNLLDSNDSFLASLEQNPIPIIETEPQIVHQSGETKTIGASF